jgi:hypothetical protein
MRDILAIVQVRRQATKHHEIQRVLCRLLEIAEIPCDIRKSSCCADTRR